jgi:Zn-dependent M28 family amino/carboxypeptidase
VAVLLELARLLGETDPGVGVDIVLFDGEDYGRGIDGDVSDYFLGSRVFARERAGKYRPKMGILLDMVGDKDLNIHVEKISNAHYPDVVVRVWNAAEALGLEQFHREPKYAIQDDHVPLIAAGMPVIDLIDFDYPYWHTMADTPDKCSAESLQAVGDLLVYLLYSK